MYIKNINLDIEQFDVFYIIFTNQWSSIWIYRGNGSMNNFNSFAVLTNGTANLINYLII